MDELDETIEELSLLSIDKESWHSAASAPLKHSRLHVDSLNDSCTRSPLLKISRVATDSPNLHIASTPISSRVSNPGTFFNSVSPIVRNASPLISDDEEIVIRKPKVQQQEFDSTASSSLPSNSARSFLFDSNSDLPENSSKKKKVNVITISDDSSSEHETNTQSPPMPELIVLNSSSKSDSSSDPIIIHDDDDSVNEPVVSTDVIQEQPSDSAFLTQSSTANEHYVDPALQSRFIEIKTTPNPETDICETPCWLSVDLLPHQKYGLRWMRWREEQECKGGILADEMGLGKTTAAISLIVQFLYDLEDDAALEKARATRNRLSEEAGEECLRKLNPTFSTLIIVPASVLAQWKDELEKKVKEDYALNVYMYTQSKKVRESISAKVLRKADVVLSTYDIVKNDVLIPKEVGVKTHGRYVNTRSALTNIFWKRIILDEAHNVRNYKTAGSIAVCSLEAECRWALTGTPLHNKLDDLYSLIKYVHEMSYCVRFIRYAPFCYLNFWKEKMIQNSERSTTRVNAIISAVMLYRSKDVISLPSKEVKIHTVTLSDEERAVYDIMLEASRQKVEEYLDEHGKENHRLPKKIIAKNVFLSNQGNTSMHVILVALLRLRQAAVHLSLTKEAVNLEAFDGVLGQIDEAENSQFAEELEQSFSARRVNRNHQVFDPTFPSSKLKAVLEVIVNCIQERQSIVVVSQFVGVLRIIANYLTDESISYVIFDGSLTQQERSSILQQFVHAKSVPVLLLSMAAGGVGLNLQTCSNMIIIEPHWNPQLEAQTCARIHRHGQKRDVVIHKFVTEQTIERRVLDLQEQKLNLANAVLTGQRDEVIAGGLPLPLRYAVRVKAS